MAKKIEQYGKELFAESDGSKFAGVKNRLIRRFATTDREKVLDLLMQYAREGSMLHWRSFLMTDIIRLVQEEEAACSGFFEWAVTQPGLTYWGMDGLLKTKGKNAYAAITGLAQNSRLSAEIRGKAIKSLAVYSGQPFDRDLPADPGHWQLADLRIAELLEWQNNGYPDGGYVQLNIHPSLQQPQTELEQLAARLDKLLAKERSKKQDPANPSNWLTIAGEDSIAAIEQRWTLPGKYLLFLKQYSPLHVYIDDERFFQGLWLYGTEDLIRRQDGYAFNGVTGEDLPDWPAGFVVIADAGADPYCIDTNNITDDDAPVYTAMHGTGKWQFELYAHSFIDFLKDITGADTAL